MTQKAIVRKLLPDGIAEIEVTRKGACSHDCSKCGGCGGAQEQRIQSQAINKVGARVGETVTIEGDNKEVFSAAAIVYVVPLVLFFAVFAVASLFGLGEGWSAVCGIVAFAIGICGAIAYNKRVRRRGMAPFVIIKRA